MEKPDQLGELFRMQRALNLRIGVHTDSMTDEEKTKWVLNYCRAMSQEMAELTDSVPWKWWAKYQKFDEQNARVEVVDLFHFLISLAQVLGKDISTLSTSLSDAVPKASKDDKIWSVMNSKEGDTPYETFNRRFDALFGEDCRDSSGSLHYVRQGKLGMGLVMLYLSKINWTKDFPLDLVALKLQHLIDELKNHQ